MTQILWADRGAHLDLFPACETGESSPEFRMPFCAIVAMSENRVIGNLGKIPWHLPEDFRWFKHKTMGGTLVMGRKTFESIGKPLPGRKTLVLTHRPLEMQGVETCSDLASFDSEYLPKHLEENYWISGGGTIYSQFLDRCHYLYLTMVKREVEGDVYFSSAEQVRKNHALDQVIHENEDFRVERWEQKEIPKNRRIPAESWPFPSA